MSAFLTRRWVLTALGLCALIAIGLVATLIVRGGTQGNPPSSLPPAPPGLRQIVDGYTVTLAPSYADANRVVLKATVSGPWFRNFAPFYVSWTSPGGNARPRLTDEAGREFPWMDGVIGYQLIGRGQADDLILAFDTSGMQDEPAALYLHLTMDVGTFGETPFKVAGPFAFDFQMPFEAGRRIALVEQTMVGPRGHLTLSQVRISRREARAFLRFEPPDAAVNTALSIQPHTAQEITLGTDTAVLTAPPTAPSDAGLGWAADQWTYSRYAALLDTGPDWMLTIPTVEQGGPQWRDVQGPWTFHFQVPRAGALPPAVTPAIVYGSPTLLPPTPSPVPPLASPVQTAWPTLPPPMPSPPARPR